MSATLDQERLLLAINDSRHHEEDAFVLSAIADLFEETGNFRAPGVRAILAAGLGVGRYFPLCVAGHWCWWCDGDPDLARHDHCGHVADAVFRRLFRWDQEGDPFRRYYPTRSAAYVALAEALSP